jgi:SAM-dependent methyltransferase
MSKLNWINCKLVKIGKVNVFKADTLEDGYAQGSGIKINTSFLKFIKKIIWPLLKMHNDFFIDGFIEYEIGKIIKKYILHNTTFLEIGCGDMSLRRFIPKNIYYNALDLEISDFHISKTAKEKNINIAIASATSIPLESNKASVIVSTETLEHIPKIKDAINEIYRIAIPGAIFICTIPNNFCYKYKKKGPHPGHINNWGFESFKFFMESNGYKLIYKKMIGWWIPIPLWITKISYQLPFSSKDEYYNTNFIYVFKIIK